MDLKLHVKNSGTISFQAFDKGSQGLLIIAETGKHIPFDIKRVYYITNTDERESARGMHAHKKTDQVIFCLKGSFLLALDDGERTQEVVMDNPAIGIRLGPKLWHSMSKFSPDCVIAVCADRHYDEDDYIRNYGEFLAHIQQQ